MRVSTSLIIWGMCSVARGLQVAGSAQRPSASCLYSFIYLSASSGTVVCSSLARRMSLSSISVKLDMNLTL